MASDYRTGIGQQQQIILENNVSVTLNTRTSIALLSPEMDGSDRIELISGEAAIKTTPGSVKPFVVVAAQVRTIATKARFNVRHSGATVCVTCLEGDLRVEHRGQASTLFARHQVLYSAGSLGATGDVDPELVTAWERGLLVFRNDPLSRVIEEVNRYRPGKIVLMSEALGRRPVLATFRIDRIDEVVPRLQSVFGVPIKALPGGIVLVG
jgi:transmembrane sensor